MSELVASLSVEEQFNRVSNSRGEAQQQAPHFSSAPLTRCLLLLLFCPQVVHCIKQRLHLLDRLPRVRIIAWIKKLRDEVSTAAPHVTTCAKKPAGTLPIRALCSVCATALLQVSGNVTWQRNRNAYARLLLEQVSSSLRPLHASQQCLLLLADAPVRAAVACRVPGGALQHHAARGRPADAATVLDVQASAIRTAVLQHRLLQVTRSSRRLCTAGPSAGAITIERMPPQSQPCFMLLLCCCRFVSPPKQPHGAYASTGSFDAECTPSSSACLAGCGSAGLLRPRSAGAAPAGSPTPRQL